MAATESWLLSLLRIQTVRDSINVLGDDDEWVTSLSSVFEGGKHMMERGNLLLRKQHVGLLEFDPWALSLVMK
jgi:hypothetical protein